MSSPSLPTINTTIKCNVDGSPFNLSIPYNEGMSLSTFKNSINIELYERQKGLKRPYVVVDKLHGKGTQLTIFNFNHSTIADLEYIVCKTKPLEEATKECGTMDKKAKKVAIAVLKQKIEEKTNEYEMVNEQFKFISQNFYALNDELHRIDEERKDIIFSKNWEQNMLDDCSNIEMLNSQVVVDGSLHGGSRKKSKSKNKSKSKSKRRSKK